MIYDLKELAKDVNAARDMGHIPSDVDKLKMRSLLAITERLEALVEAQKPRLQGEPDRNENETPQPVATLCEAAEALMLFVDQHCNYHDLDPLLADCRHALAAERKRQEIRDRLIFQVDKRWMKSHLNDKQSDKELMEAVEEYRRRIAALDAFDKGAENG